MVATYQKLYDEYSKKYGSNTAIFLMVGKFYEMYCYIDSVTGEPSNSMKRAIERMNIALKDKKQYGPKGEPGLWGGIPEQSCHKFAQVLTRDGWTVVVVDQIKDSTDTVIDRRPVRILSPGTHVEVAAAERMAVASVWITTTSLAASLIDLTTGEVFSFVSKDSDTLLHMFQVYSVKEVVCCQVGTYYDTPTLRTMFGIHGLLHSIHPLSHDNFEQPLVREEYLRKMFRLKTMIPLRSAIGVESPLQERALCLLLRFVEDHFPQQAERITRHEVYTPSHHMRLSNNILEQLNMITYTTNRSILNMLEKTHSAIGKRALRERILCPITEEAELERRWRQVEWAMELSTRQEYERDLKSLYDIPRLHYRLAEGTVEAVDVLQMFQSYSAIYCLVENLRNTPLACPERVEDSFLSYREEFNRLMDEDKATERVNGMSIGFLTPIAGPQTAQIEARIQVADEIWKTAWSSVCKALRIPSDSFVLEKKADGEYGWEGSRTYLKPLESLASIPQLKLLHEIIIEKKKAGPLTLHCRELSVYLDTLKSSTVQLNKQLKEELVLVCDQLWETIREFQTDLVEWIGRVDCTFALASVAKEFRWCKPSLWSGHQEGSGLSIQGLRHPLLDTAQTRLEYVKHTVELGTPNRPGGWLLYGVNASGKSSLMKATGIAVLLAQAGSFVPADSMRLRPYASAFSRIWSHDNVWAGLSSFAVEITELRDILANATNRSLVLGDEVCSGTESLSATALVASTLEHLDRLGAHFMFATHLHDLQKVPGFLPRPGIAVWHLRVLRQPDGKLVYDRTLQPGSGSTTYGLEVARAMGIPVALLDRAHEIRRALEGEVTIEEAPRSSWNSSIQRHVCEVCGCSIVNHLEVHHIVPRCEGGSNELRNLVVLCESCHDKHHAGELSVGSLKMTSEGPERESVLTPQASGKRASTKWTDEEKVAILAIVTSYKTRPPKRILLAIKEELNLSLTPSQLREFMRQAQAQ